VVPEGSQPWLHGFTIQIGRNVCPGARREAKLRTRRQMAHDHRLGRRAKSDSYPSRHPIKNDVPPNFPGPTTCTRLANKTSWQLTHSPADHHPVARACKSNTSPGKGF